MVHISMVKIVTLQAGLGCHCYYGLTHRSQLSDNLYKYIVSRSLIAKHPIQNCQYHGRIGRCSILYRLHSDFYMKCLKKLLLKSMQPSLCKQKECLLELNVICIKIFSVSTLLIQGICFPFLVGTYFYFVILNQILK